MKLAIAGALLASTVAHADRLPAGEPALPAPVADPVPDPAAAEAGNANLNSTWRRTGTTVTFAFGPGLTIGLGFADSVGGGGSGSLRITHAATARGLLTAEITGVVLLHQIDTTMPNDKRNRNDDTNLMVGALLYVNRALWVRGALGFGHYKGRDVDIESDGTRNDVTLVGPCGAVGAGIDLVRLNHFVMDIEMVSISMLNREGILSSSGVMLGLSIN